MWGLIKQINDLQREKRWTINTLRTIIALGREPTKADLLKVLEVLEKDAEGPDVLR